MDTRVAPKVMHYGLKSIRFTKMVKNYVLKKFEMEKSSVHSNNLVE